MLVQDLCQNYCQILSIISNELIKLNINMDTIMKNAENARLNTKIVSAVFNTNVKDDLIVYKYLCSNRNY